jgi:hypothetical protein
MCILCTSTDEIHTGHDDPITRLPSGKGQGGDVGGYGEAPGLHGMMAAVLNTLARHEATIAAQGEAIARLEAAARRSETP